ncbi:hypothetical protein [Taibaiella chishuiensis]|uniref:Uncharacterized protein n=1 Tax=Taibaiella chishuiensis TaxID=1434707 RepID=A0A2P8CX31_9BACT|nr:hypothetical protein [Taibaiella chishuiensis]PSK89531.1 hypothetical protein B0I18_11186 [Taibaiella chishuiensis]
MPAGYFHTAPAGPGHNTICKNRRRKTRPGNILVTAEDDGPGFTTKTAGDTRSLGLHISKTRAASGQIAEYLKGKNGGVYMVVHDRVQLEVSVRKKEILARLFDNLGLS